MELKRQKGSRKLGNLLPFNRTTMELKLSEDDMTIVDRDVF